MAKSTGPILAVGAITLFNDVVVHKKTLGQDVRVLIAAGGAALVLGLIEQASETLAVGLAWMALITVLFTRMDPKTPAPLESIANWYNAK